MKNAIVTYIYPSAEKYLSYFLNSYIRNTKKIELIIFNDGVDNELIIKKIKSYETINFKIVKLNSDSPAKIREKSFKYLIENYYEKVIFADIDDTFSKKRIEKSLEYLDKYDFVYNNIILIDDNLNEFQNKYFFKNKYIPDITYDFKQILYKNYLGLSNTAVNVSLLKNIEIPKNIIAVDWYLYSKILLKNKKGKYLEDVYTNYRQYEYNTVVSNKNYDYNTLKRQIDIVYNHYKELAKKINDGEVNNIYNEIDNIKDDELKIKELLNVIHSTNEKLLWWEWIKYIRRL